MRTRFFPLIVLLYLGFQVHANTSQNSLETSIAGFFELKKSGREVFNFNPGWRFFRGDVKNGESMNFDDSSWEIVSTPHSVALVPAEASGNRNYQGPAWYRKRFVLDKNLSQKDVTLHFEAIMGKSDFYVNGKKYGK